MWRNKLSQVFLLMTVAAWFTLLMAGRAGAVLVRDMPMQVKQPDGTPLTVYLTGDEFERYLHDAGHFTIIQDPQTRWYVYAKTGARGLDPTPYVAGKADPAALGLTPDARPPEAVRAAKRGSKMKQMGRPAGANGAAPGAEPMVAPTTGHINNLVIFIRFQGDPEITETFDHYDDMYNDTTHDANSLVNYITEVSEGQMEVTSTLLPTSTTNMLSYLDNHPRGYYQPYDASTNPDGYGSSGGGSRWLALLGNAVEFVADQVPDDLDIDINDDGHIDSICFVPNGPAGSDELWAYMSKMGDANAYINDKLAWTYDSYPRGMLDTAAHGVGVICHEFLHIMGAPDQYRTGCTGVSPVGPWDVMADTANPPQHPNAWVKHHYIGWLDSIGTIDTPGTYSLFAEPSDFPTCKLIPSPFSTTEFLMVEYRRKAGPFESSVPGSGMVVYRINTEGENVFGPPDQVFAYRPGQSTSSLNGDLTLAHFSAGTGRTLINDTTDPACTLTDGSPGGIIISNVGNASGTISFTLDFNATPPARPTWPAAHPASYSAIDLTWEDNATNEDNHEIQRNTAGAGGPWTACGTPAADVTSYRVSGLSSDTLYYFRVRAVNAWGPSDWSTVVSATTYQLPPDAPSNLHLTEITESSMRVNWNDNSTTERGFKVECQPGGTGIWTLVRTLPNNSTAFTLSGLSAGTLYSFRVCAYTLGGDSAYSSVASATTTGAGGAPAAPTSLVATATSSSVIRLTWNDNSGNESCYYVYHKPTSSPYFSLLATIPINSTHYTHEGLNPGTSHTYRVLAHNSSGDTPSTSSATAVTLTLPPENLVLVVDLDPQHISGEPLEGAINANGLNAERVVAMPSEIDPNTYLSVFVALGADEKHTLTDTEGQTLLDYLEGSGRSLYLEGGFTFWYDAVRLDESTPVHPCFGIEGDGTLGFSSVSDLAGESGTFTDGIESGLSQSGGYHDHLAVASGYADAFPIWHDQDGTVIFGIAREATSYSTIGTSVQFGMLEAGVQTYVMAKYLNFFLGSTGLPSAPTGLAARVEGWSSVILDWTDQSGNETGFRIDRQNLAGGPWEQLGSVPAGTQTFQDTSLVPGTAWYRVCAFNTTGDSAYSNVVEVTTITPPPAAASNLVVESIGANTIRLTWADNSDTESGFMIWRRGFHGFIPGSWQDLKVVRTNSVTWDDDTVHSESRYDYKIVAWNQAGDAPASNVATTFTPVCDGIPHPAAWTTFPQSAVPGVNYTLAWTDSSSQHLYEVLECTQASFIGPTSLIVNESQVVRAQTPPAPRYFFYRVRSGRACDGASEYSAWSAIRHLAVKSGAQTEPADLDENESVNAADLLIMANFLAGNSGLNPSKNGDLNADGVANSLDLAYILHFLANHF